MNRYKIINIREKPEIRECVAKWFHSKWGIPIEAYKESLEFALKDNVNIPSWYICLNKDEIIGGLGVIENDFHDRKDLTPYIY